MATADVLVSEMPDGSKRVSWWEGVEKVEYVVPANVPTHEILSAIRKWGEGEGGDVTTMQAGSA